MLVKESLKKIMRLLFFKISREEMLKFNKADLYVGLVVTWIVGLGRYWDAPNAEDLQYIGAGSLIYIFVLALLIWLIVKPLQVKDWTYRRLLTFISLTSAPALLYAIPVERFFEMKTAAWINVWFLAIVATWRVALLVFYFKKFALFTWFKNAVLTLFPLSIIVTILTTLNLEKVAFSIMGGIRDQSANDGAYKVLVFLTILYVYAIVPIFISYLVIIFIRRSDLRAAKTSSFDNE